MTSTSLIFVLSGLGITLAVTAIALPTGFIIGLMLAIATLFGGKLSSFLITLYSRVMRGIPPVVLLFLLYFVLANVVNLGAFWACALALAIISSGYQLEIFRGALLSVSSGQMTAARALGMNKSKAVFSIILPQALRIAIPPWSNEVANLLKDSSLAYVVGVPEVLKNLENIASTTKNYLAAYAIAALIYFVFIFAFNRLLDLLEKRTRLPGF